MRQVQVHMIAMHGELLSDVLSYVWHTGRRNEEAKNTINPAARKKTQDSLAETATIPGTAIAATFPVWHPSLNH